EDDRSALLLEVAAGAGGTREQGAPLVAVADRVGHRILNADDPATDRGRHALRDRVRQLSREGEVDRSDAARRLAVSDAHGEHRVLIQPGRDLPLVIEGDGAHGVFLPVTGSWPES